MRYPCPDCEFAATTELNLKSRAENKHKGVRYPCPQCEYAASRASLLKIHTGSNHDGVLILNVIMLQLQQGI